MSKDFYYINGAYSPQTYAVIYGTLVKGRDMTERATLLISG